MRLARRNLLLGGNGSGKTTITQGIKIVALGYDPALGKRPMDQAAIMAEPEMNVRLFLEDEEDRAIMRTIKRGDKGYEMLADASWLSSSAKHKEHVGAIENLFGRDANEIAQSLDLAELLKLTPMKRAAVLEELLGAVDENPAVVARQIIHHALIKIIGIVPEKAPEGNGAMMAMLAEKQTPILKTAGGVLIAKLTAHGIDGAMSWARAEALSENKSLKEKTAAEKELRAKLHGLAETQPEELDRLAEDLRTAEAAITAEKTKREAWGTNEKGRKAAAEDVSRFLHLGAEKNAELAGLGAEHPDIDKERAELDKIHETLGAMPPAAPLDLTGIPELRKQAEAKREEAGKIVFDELPSVEAETKKLDAIQAAIEADAIDPWRKVHTKAGALLASIRMWDHAPGDRVDQKLGPMAQIATEIHAIASSKAGADPKTLERQAGEALTALEEAHAVRKHAEGVESEQKAESARLLAEAETLHKEGDEMLAALEAKAAQARKEIEAAGAKLRARRDELRPRIEAYDAKAQTIRDAAQEWKDKHAKATGRLQGLNVAAEEPRGDLEEMERTRAALATEKETLEASAGKRAAISDLVREIAAAKIAAEVYAALHDGAKLVRSAGVTEAGSGLTKLMGSFLAAGAWPHVPYIRATQKACEIGWRHGDGTEIPIQAMSGGEWCLFAASLSASMIALRKAEIRILIVEAGEADLDHLFAILKGIESMGDALTASLVLTHVPIIFETEGWERHEFEREGAAA